MNYNEALGLVRYLITTGISLDEAVSHGARVRTLAAQGEVERRIPPGHWILTAHGVGDIGIMAHSILFSKAPARLRNWWTRWPCYQSPQPIRFVFVDIGVDVLNLLIVKTLE